MNKKMRGIEAIGALIKLIRTRGWLFSVYFWKLNWREMSKHLGTDFKSKMLVVTVG